MADPRRSVEAGPAPAGPRRPAPRGWWPAFALLLAVCAAGWGWMLQRPAQEYAPAAAPAPAPSPTPAIPEIARRQVWTSDTPASGTYAANTVTLEPRLQAGRVVPYRVQVEDTTGLDADDVAREVQATFDDERGWAGYGRRSFALVTDDARAELTIYIASPRTTDALCAPLDVASKWNCRVGPKVVLNSDRWRFMTPTYDDLGSYRSYLVNHEVGHFLGQGHVGCPTAGARAPVMMQQSIRLDGCTPNAWPREADSEGRR